MKEKIKNWAPILLVLFTITIISLLLIFKDSKSAPNIDYDTSFLENITTAEAIEEFKSTQTKIYIIGRSTCSACQSFLPTLKDVVTKYNLKIYYLDLISMYKDEASLNQLKQLLDYKYTLENKTNKLSAYLGTTPMIIISQNNENIYGYLGTLTKEDLEKILRSYELI